MIYWRHKGDEYSRMGYERFPLWIALRDMSPKYLLALLIYFQFQRNMCCQRILVTLRDDGTEAMILDELINDRKIFYLEIGRRMHGVKLIEVVTEIQVEKQLVAGLRHSME